ncbi:hypothetical protein LWI28_008735 [Acer negundo]|uniref:Uncharacterized protein n=1 Tax=Acer negundo TaxID=4023 RepID=A0AAD5IDW1_ACENE|nr:hypothetical protein LWI28_008735 [Acer negundo]
MKEVLIKRFGFEPSRMELLTDAPGPRSSLVMPTVDMEPGHPFRQDEAIVPTDFNLITESLKPHDEGILLSGCQANETSDMNPVEGGGKAYRAFSDAVQSVLKENSEALSNREVVMMARKVLEEKKVPSAP